MNQRFVAAALVLCVGLAQGAMYDEYRMLTSKDGRSIEAKLLAFNPDKNQVQVEPSGGKKLWVPVAAFSDETQTYIQEWTEADKILSPRSLLVSIEKTTGHKSEYKESFCYKIDLRNQSGGVLDDVKIEYRFFIHLYSDRFEIANPERVISGQLKLDRLDHLKEKTLETRYVLEFEEFPNNQSEFKHYDMNGNEFTTKYKSHGRCVVEGIWIRIHGPSVDGEPTYRDICDPEHILYSVKWDEKRPPLGKRFTFTDFGKPDKDVMSLDEVQERGKPKDRREYSDWKDLVYDQMELKLSREEQQELLRGLMFFYNTDYETSANTAARIGSACKKIEWLEEAAKWYEIALEKEKVTHEGEKEYKGSGRYLAAGVYRRALINLYACSIDPAVRNGPKAVEYAGILLEYDSQDPRLLDLLARAYAANNEFELAVKTQRYAIRECADSSKTRHDLPKYKERMELYQKGQPYLQKQADIR
ncbi:hypothetical protein P4C99_16335 [Pontiellaceae bacterium B1224]|nr:hypothetical protein [Pontiellaceae bacterium B1224]